MSETGASFQDGDIVWVKLGGTWWPGEVKNRDNLPSDVEFKTEPLYIVKFFEEDSYEYVKSEQHIFPYNCERKNEFIKKGMASFRSKVTHMQKFPKDVTFAEVQVGGNPNILSDPMFQPEKRRNYSEDFGTPSPKKTPKTLKKKKKSTSKKSSSVNVTHRRFIGYDDYRTEVCIQFPGKDIIGDTEEREEIVRINKELPQVFSCQKCHYTTTRLEVFVFHTKSHIQGTYVSMPSAKKSKKVAVKRPRKEKPQVDSDSSLDEFRSPKTPRRKTVKASPKKAPKEKKATPIDIKNDLLAEWEDSDDEDDVSRGDKTLDVSLEDEEDKTVDDDEKMEETVDETVADKSDDEIAAEKSEDEKADKIDEEKADKSDDEMADKSDDEKADKSGDKTAEKIDNGTADETVESINDEKVAEKTVEEAIKKSVIPEQSSITKDIKSCFDFDEEDEDEPPIVETVVGRKIPRVIPPSEKRRSSDFEQMELPEEKEKDKVEDEEEEINREETLKISQSFNELPEVESNESLEEHDKSFRELLEATAMPVLSEVENTLKCEQNFHETKTIKFPDKTEPTESSKSPPPVDNKPEPEPEPQPVATKLTNPKKRFVKSFEDFELLQNEQRRKAEEEKLEEPKPEEVKPIQEVKPPEVTQEDIKPSEEESMKITNLKSRIMGKIQENTEEPEPTRRKSVTHQGPRNKFLESYNNENKNSEVKDEIAIAERLGIDTLSPEKKEICPPKKKLWPRRRTSSRRESIDKDKDSDKSAEVTEKENVPESQSETFKDVVEELSSKKEESDFSVLETSAVLPDDAICTPTAVNDNLIDKDNKGENQIEFEEDTSEQPVERPSLTTKEEQSAIALASLAESTKPIDTRPTLPIETETVEIDERNLRVVSEEELAKGEVEITAGSTKKPVTLQNFSMDFTESNNDLGDILQHDSSNVVLMKSLKSDIKPPSKPLTNKFERFELLDILEGNSPRTPEPSVKSIPPKPLPVNSNDIMDFEEHIPSQQIVRTKNAKPHSDEETTEEPTISKMHVKKPYKKIVKPNKPTKRTYEEMQDVEDFIIPKTIKKAMNEETKLNASKIGGKAKILQQTIITPEGNIIQPKGGNAPQPDETVFDINSMPIVLSDEILTPENIEQMPMVIEESKPKIVQTPKKVITTQNKILNQALTKKPTTTPKIIKNTKLIQSVMSTTTKLVKQPSILTSSVKANSKYLLMPQPSVTASSPAMKGKKPAIIKRPLPQLQPETVGNKIMVVTNDQGQQQRLVLTPADQKRLGCTGATKLVKPLMKSNYINKTNLINAGPSGVTKIRPIGNKYPTGTTITSQQILSKSAPANKVLINKQPKTYVRQKTILIKNQHGQTVKTIQGTDDALLDKQVAEQIEAIKASNALRLQQKQKNQAGVKPVLKAPFKKSYPPKKSIVIQQQQQQQPETQPVPPLAPIVKKSDTTEQKSSETPTDRPLHQLVIQDALGNQTTITEGQILALPSETVDGQPQSYMLVTLDESGNLTPLNSEALMSLDPSLLGGGDLSNMVLQIDQGGATAAVAQSPVVTEAPELPKEVPEVKKAAEVVAAPAEPVVEKEEVVPPAADAGQQLIVTGDPIATQKFLETLTDGTTDLANILANADGGSILIQADGQQILINTNSDNQVLVSVNSDNLNSESGGNPMLASQPSNKNQDILAAALADTDVFQQDQSSAQSKIPSQLSPGSTLYPMNVSNVLETSLTLNSPIMTPLEVPSTNSKKIPDEEADILTQVPKNVNLPITITDPNISQTVAQQQVLLGTDLQTNLELNLPISEATIAVSSTEMNSPSFVYSLPSLDDINQKPFNSSMPLLTEDVEESTTTESAVIDKVGVVEESTTSSISPTDSNGDSKKGLMDGFTEEEEEGLCTLGGEMCSSLSEPPPDMFDLQASNFLKSDSTVESNSPATLASEDSCEIPVQPPIVAELGLDGTDSNSSTKTSTMEDSENL